jgi:hypothetical protein
MYVCAYVRVCLCVCVCENVLVGVFVLVFPIAPDFQLKRVLKGAQDAGLTLIRRYTHFTHFSGTEVQIFTLRAPAV